MTEERKNPEQYCASAAAVYLGLTVPAFLGRVARGDIYAGDGRGRHRRWSAAVLDAYARKMADEDKDRQRTALADNLEENHTPWLDAAQICLLLDLSPSGLHKWRKSGKINEPRAMNGRLLWPADYALRLMRRWNREPWGLRLRGMPRP